jgi:hypothetical protein
VTRGETLDPKPELIHCGALQFAMSPTLLKLGTLALATALLLVCLGLRSDSTSKVSTASSHLSQLPRHTLWAWERREDLRQVDPKSTAIAYLDQTLVIGSEVTRQSRRQSIVYPSSVARIAVTRIEVLPEAILDAEHERQTVAQLLRSAAEPGISVLQVDFDATRSQRSFYRRVLIEFRRQMPPQLPLSITALASWCSNDDWIADLPVDEAVPMLFRMEPDRRRTSLDLPQFRIREPLCMGSVGVSTREAWPPDMAGKRVYVFPDRGWHEDLPLLAERKLP